MSNVVIDIAAEFTGKKSFKQADTATDKLNKGVKNLGRNLGIALSVGAVLSFAKASVKAAAEDEKAQRQLALALTNVGLARDVAGTESFIAKLESEFGIVDDKLRPAYQSLAIATKDTVESQKLLQIALDVSAANSLDLEAVSKALSKAYLGNNTSLGKLGVGISKADLKAKSFDEIMNDLAGTFKGAATANAKTFSGQMAKLSVSFSNAQEIIGKGLIDSLMILTESENLDSLQTSIVNFATTAAESFRKLAGFLKENEGLLKSIAKILLVTFVGTKLIAGITAVVTAIQAVAKAMRFLRNTAIGAAIAQAAVLNPLAAVAYGAALLGVIAATVKGVEALTDKYEDLNVAMENAQGLAHLAELESKYAIKTLATKKKLTEEELKALKAKRLQQAIDKANLALGKGSEVFDMEKIQNAAALTNQAEQLGKATNGSQILQIANDTARLNLKRSISQLEDAIALKDEAAIIAATKRLNEDVKIYNAISGQNIQMKSIETILNSLKPKDLINLDNLYKALELLKQIAGGGASAKGSTGSALGAPSMPSSLNPISGAGGVRGAKVFSNPELQYFEDLNEYMYRDLFAGGKNPFATSSSSSAPVTIVNNFGVVGDPNAAAELMNQTFQEAIDRGTLRVTR